MILQRSLSVHTDHSIGATLLAYFDGVSPPGFATSSFSVLSHARVPSSAGLYGVPFGVATVRRSDEYDLSSLAVTARAASTAVPRMPAARQRQHCQQASGSHQFNQSPRTGPFPESHRESATRRRRSSSYSESSPKGFIVSMSIWFP